MNSVWNKRNKERLRFRIEKLITSLVYKLGFEDHIIQVKRNLIGKKIFENYSGVIAFGEFKGTQLQGASVWSGYKDTGTKILGLYEKQIVDWIALHPRRFDLFVDVGAADGFYAIGLLKKNLVGSAITYEISMGDRAVCKSMSELNSVRNQISMKDKAEKMDLIQVLSGNSHTLVLVDIEGGEFDLIDAEVLETGKDKFFVIEIHARIGTKKFFEFFSLCQTFHECEVITGTKKDFPRDDFTNDLSDNERSLLMSEGRPYQMGWFVLSPRK